MPLAAFPKCFIDAICVDKSMTVYDWIEATAPMDIDGLEFYWPMTPANDPKEITKLRQTVERQGRSIPMMCYSPDFTHPDLADRQREVAAEKHALKVSQDLGIQYCRVLSGQRRPEVSLENGIQWVRECIEELIPTAEEHKITLILENHYKDGFWDFPEFAQKKDVFLSLLDAIPESPWFGVNYDPSNAITAGDDPIDLLQSVKHRIRTMHASDRYFEGGTLEDLQRMDTEAQKGYATILKHGIIGKGLNDYDQIFSILKEVGFNSWISIEDGPDPDKGIDDITQSAIFLRKKMAEHGLT
jgi:sugar phosphate isomerase/epimerase